MELLLSFMSWGGLSAVLIAVSGLHYMWGIVSGQVPRPVRSTWGIWAVLGLLLLLTYSGSGARVDSTLLAAWIGFINPVIIFFLALKFGTFEWKRLDTVCVAICVVSLAVWWWTNDPFMGLIGLLVTDAMGALPQVRATWKQPGDEPVFPWAMFCLGSAVNLLAVDQWTVTHYLYPVYMTVESAFIVLPLIVYRIAVVIIRRSQQ